MRNTALNFILFLPRVPFLFLIRYQRTISRITAGINLVSNGYCRFYPTCSEYGYQTIKDGLIIGLLKLLVFTRNPWSKGGVDLP